MKPSETANVETILNLPTKQEEFDLFTNYDLIAVFDRYLPLADYILDEYASINDETSMHVEETAYMALINTIVQFRRRELYKTITPITQYISSMIYSFMEDYEKEGKVYKISKTFAVK